jgi:hypothetical protein
VLEEIHEYRTLDTVFQGKLRIWANTVHLSIYSGLNASNIQNSNLQRRNDPNKLAQPAAPASQSNGITEPRRSWLASEEARKTDATFNTVFAGKPAPASGVKPERGVGDRQRDAAGHVKRRQVQ